MKLIKIKNSQKNSAQRVKECKRNFKKIASLFSKNKLESTETYYKSFYKSNSLSYHFRHAHIAYSLLRGRSYLQIENKIRPFNDPSVPLINSYLESFCFLEGLSKFPKFIKKEDECFNMLNIVLEDWEEVKLSEDLEKFLKSNILVQDLEEVE